MVAIGQATAPPWPATYIPTVADARQPAVDFQHQRTRPARAVDCGAPCAMAGAPRRWRRRCWHCANRRCGDPAGAAEWAAAGRRWRGGVRQGRRRPTAPQPRNTDLSGRIRGCGL